MFTLKIRKQRYCLGRFLDHLLEYSQKNWVLDSNRWGRFYQPFVVIGCSCSIIANTTEASWSTVSWRAHRFTCSESHTSKDCSIPALLRSFSTTACCSEGCPGKFQHIQEWKLPFSGQLAECSAILSVEIIFFLDLQLNFLSFWN